jgi:hypothetical protein
MARGRTFHAAFHAVGSGLLRSSSTPSARSRQSRGGALTDPGSLVHR